MAIQKQINILQVAFVETRAVVNQFCLIEAMYLTNVSVHYQVCSEVLLCLDWVYMLKLLGPFGRTQQRPPNDHPDFNSVA